MRHARVHAAGVGRGKHRWSIDGRKEPEDDQRWWSTVSGVISFKLSGLRDFSSEVKMRRRISLYYWIVRWT